MCKNIYFKNLKYIIEEETDDYFIGVQQNLLKKTEMKLISFKNLMVLDYDNTTLDNIENILCNYPYTFLVYKTYSGYHVYNISEEFPRSNSTLQLMHDMKCDYYYINFCKYTGFTVRLDKKKDRKEEYIEKYVKQINNYLINDKLKELVKYKDNLTCI